MSEEIYNCDHHIGIFHDYDGGELILESEKGDYNFVHYDDWFKFCPKCGVELKVDKG